MRGVPEAEQPREKLVRLGAEQLDDSDLVALLIASGYRGKSAKALAVELLSEYHGLPGLARLSLEELAAVKGLGRAKGGALVAALEAGRRVAQSDKRERLACGRPAAVAEYLLTRHAHYPQERLGALYLDAKHRLLDEKMLFQGTLNAATVAPREVFKYALLAGAAGVVIFHNHPSGDPEPSFEDGEFTRRVAESGRMLGVTLVDHIVLGEARWVSLRERREL